MTFSKSAAASFLALSLFLIPAVAPVQAQEAEAPVAAAPAELLDAANALVSDRRASQELSDDELKQRSRQARQMLRNKALPDDVKPQLQAIFESDRAELESRASAAKTPEPQPEPVQEAAPQPEPQPEPVQEAAPQPEPKAEEQAQQPEPTPAPVAEVPQAVTDVLNDRRSVDELSDEDLAARAKFARQQSRNEALPEDIRKKLAAIGREARGAMAARQKADLKKQEAAETPAAPAAEQPVTQQVEPQPQPETAPVAEPVPETKAVTTEVPTPPPPAVDKVEAKELDGNAGDPEAEKKARAFLDDAAPAESLNDEALRARLDGMRDLMAENELSQKTERELRNKLRTEREVLRTRVAKAKADEEAKAASLKTEEEKKKQEAAAEAGQPVPKKDKKPNINIIISAETPFDEILRDRRRAEELEESELRYRVRAWRQFESSDRFRDFDEDQRNQWRERTRRDREYLGGRLREERNIRRVELEKPSNIRRIVIEDDQDFASDDVPEDIFAAEVDDEQIERALLAPPRKKVARKFTVDEIAAQPKARAALTRIEVDTIRFGFNEAFVREEEVDNLDQIASVIERVLTKYPREVFLIEGHTDAVGSDPYNDKLSKARAEAVKKALSTYYVIPAKNLKTVGLGERYLKIPTAEAEQENRRVSISRATAVIGEAED